jgi:apolipoprotein N-acyltransferase
VSAKAEATGLAAAGAGRGGASNVQRAAVGVLLAVLSAIISIVAHPPYAIGPLALVMYVPMLVAQHHVLPRRAAGLAPAIAIGGAAWWGLSHAVPRGANLMVRASPIVIAVLLLGAGVLDRVLMERTRYRFFVFAVPLVWTAIAVATVYGPTGSIGTTALAMHRLPALIQPVSVVGSIGLILVINLANWALGAIALGVVGHRSFRPRRMLRIAVATGVVGVVWIGASLLMLGGTPERSVRVAAIQPGSFSHPEIGSPASAAIERFEAQTKKAAADGAQLVVWTEGGLPFDPAVVETERLKSLARDARIYIAVGYGVFEPGRTRNEAILVTPDGRFLGPYSKQHPVTFLGERSDSDHGYPVFDLPIGRTALLICYDLDFFDTPRRMARQGAGLLAVPSNDWSEISDVHYASFVLRAIENDVSIVKADTAWDSAIVDPHGRVLAKKVSPQGARATLVADVPVGSGRTIASAVGDLNGLVVVLAALSMLVVVIVRARRARDDAGTAT